MFVTSQNGWTALMKAASSGYTRVVAELVKAKANLNLQNNVGTLLPTIIIILYICSIQTVDSYIVYTVYIV